MTDTDFAQLELRVRRLRRLDSCAVSDALDRLGLDGVVSGVPQQSGSGRIAGVAITLKVGVGSPAPGPVRHLGTLAIETASSAHVIVIEQRSGIDAGCWGGLLSLAASLRGVAGVVADGPVRDIDEACSYEFPIFTRQLTARTARGRVIELATNAPIHPWEVAVRAGDFVLADRSAVIFISTADIDQVLAEAETISAREAAMAKALLERTAPSVVMGGSYEHMLNRS